MKLKLIIVQHIESVPLSNLTVGGYQRPTNTKQVNNISKSFDEAKLGLLVVSRREGKYHLLDGAHRASAMRQIGYTHVMCIVLEGLLNEEEAEYFRKHNENSRKLTIYNMFKAGLEAGDKVCIDINEIAKENGFIVGTSGRSWKPNTLSAINALMTIYKVYGYDILNRTLRLLVSTWD